MGLHITALADIEKIVPYEVGKDEPEENTRFIWKHPSFPATSEGIESGLYRHEAFFTVYVAGFHTYDRWREKLCGIVHRVTVNEVFDDPDNYVGEPFAELICFSDSKGSIGPVASKKLARDFADHLIVAEVTMDAQELRIYKIFLEAFKLASDNGAVKFW